MIEKLFPKDLTNTFRGVPVSRWIFIAMVVMTIARAVVYGGMTT